MARVTVIERAIVTLAYHVEQLRQDVIDSLDEDVLESSHDEHRTETLD